MQSQSTNHQSLDLSSEGEELAIASEMTSAETSEGSENINYPPFRFVTEFRGLMGMYADLPTVAEYLNAHEGWFCRCAQPMTAEPLGENGYILTVGRFQSFGYEVEPKMAAVLLPPEDNLYVMHSVEIPDYSPPGYDVNFRSSLTLAEADGEVLEWHKPEIAPVVTKIDWQLYLEVIIQFPKFIYKLPQKLIQNTGDRLLAQIVRQISPRLTYKVQKDFHDRLELPLPPKSSRQLLRLEKEEETRSEVD